MFCIQCGTENTDQAIFCRICGQRLEIEDKPTGPVALSTNSDQVSVSATPILSEQFWLGAPSELSIEDAPTALSNTPLPEQYSASSIDAMPPVAAEVFYPPTMDIASAATYPTFPPMSGSLEAQVEIAGGVSEPPYGTP